jgi:hypothetical protein
VVLSSFFMVAIGEGDLTCARVGVVTCILHFLALLLVLLVVFGDSLPVLYRMSDIDWMESQAKRAV